MKVIRVKKITPKQLYNRIFKSIKDLKAQSRFARKVNALIDLDAKTTKNFDKRGLALFQLSLLAHEYDIDIIFEEGAE